MAHYQNKHAPPPQSDEYGNPVRQTDEYGNPIPHGGATARTTGYGTTTTGGTVGQEGHKLHRSGSGSSSEDDGKGGRRKKGVTEKIKEKLPGTHKDHDHQTHTTATTPGGGYHVPLTGGQEGQRAQPEKKGIVDKIKEKLPGQHGT